MPSFLPQYPLEPNPLLLFGFLLLAGVIGGEVVQRVLAVPRIVGYVVIGLLLGAGGLNVLDARLTREAWIFVELALGLLLFELGCRLDFTWLKRDAWLAATGVLESALTFWLLFFVLTLFDVSPLYAAVASAIGIATSPAVVMVVAQELRAEGQVTERALNLTAMNSVISFVVVTMLLAGVHHEYRADWGTVVLHPLYLLLGSALLGLLASVLVVGFARWLGKSGREHFVMTLSMIVVTIGAARLFELSVVLALLSFGVLSRNLDRRHDLMPFDPGPLEHHVAVHVEPQPGEPVQDHLHGFRRGALPIRVLHPQDELTAVAAGIEPAEERRAHTADVQHAGRTGGETGADGHGWFRDWQGARLYQRDMQRPARTHWKGAAFVVDRLATEP